MLYWLATDAADISQTPAEFLSAAELETYASMRFAKRRDEWLVGRWTAKQLVQRVVYERAGKRVALDQLEIFNDVDGVPYVRVEGGEFGLPLSLSHSSGRALAAVGEEMVGADIELIQSHPPDLFDPITFTAEFAQVDQAGTELRETLLTVVWSAKEATLKALHKGLSVEPRTVEITFQPLPTNMAPWMHFGIAFESADYPPLVGWWGVQGHYVVALAARAPQASPIQASPSC